MKRYSFIILLLLPLSLLAQVQILVQDTTIRYIWQNGDWQQFKRTVYADFPSSGVWKSATVAYFDTLTNQWNDSIFIRRTFFDKDHIESYFSYINNGSAIDTVEYKKYDINGNLLIEQEKNLSTGNGSKILTTYNDYGKQTQITFYVLEAGVWKFSMRADFEYNDTLLEKATYYWQDDLGNIVPGFVEQYFYDGTKLDSALFYTITDGDTAYNYKHVITANLPDGDWQEYINYVYYNGGFQPYEKYWRSTDKDTFFIRHWYEGQWIDTVQFTVFDQNGNQTFYVRKKWYWNAPNPLYGTKQLSSYNNGLQVLNIIYNLQSNQWIPSVKQTQVYNDYGYPMSKRIFAWDADKNSWVLGNEYLYDYAVDHLLSFTYYIYPDGVIPLPQLKEIYLWHTYLAGVNATQNEITIYPVPAHDYLNIQGATASKARIIDINGKTMLNINNINGSINISSLPPGVYTIIIDNSTAKKFIKY